MQGLVDAQGGLSGLHVLKGQSHQALAACDVTLIASGTATLEAAITDEKEVLDALAQEGRVHGAGQTKAEVLLEQTDKVRTTQMFNSGRTDALVLNVAGSTGISLHASEKFEDQRQRHMIIGQAAGDINIFMQMLGRIHRTGQVVLPKYTILSVDLPTE